MSARDDNCRLCLIAVFLDTALCQTGSQQLCISKITFACTCLAFYSFSITPFVAFCLQYSVFFTLVFYIHIR